jgi:CBS domain-containing protein
MTIQELISSFPPALGAAWSVGEAVEELRRAALRALPVVDADDRLVGIITVEMLENISEETPIMSLLVGGPVCAAAHMHVFDAARMLVDHQLDILPVVGEDGAYAGLLRRVDIFELLTHMLSIDRPGAVLEIDIPENDYTLTRLVHTVEEHDGKILSITTDWPELRDASVRITLKLSVTEAARIRAVLEHHGYRIVASYNEDTTDSEIQQRIREFMHYLDV